MYTGYWVSINVNTKSESMEKVGHMYVDMHEYYKRYVVGCIKETDFMTCNQDKIWGIRRTVICVHTGPAADHFIMDSFVGLFWD